MAAWKITPLCLGYITRPKKNFFEDYTGTEIEPFPVNSFYLTDGTHKIVVDNGGCSPELEGLPRGVAGKPYTRTADQVIDAALKNIGVDINDIEAIIFTHLHWDHAFNTHLFPKNTRLICQKKELESLDDPDEPSNKIGYVREYLHQFEYEKVDGDAEVFRHIYSRSHHRLPEYHSRNGRRNCYYYRRPYPTAGELVPQSSEGQWPLL